MTADVENIDPEDVKRVLENPGFNLIIERMKDANTRKVMSKTTNEEARAEHLAEYHAICRLVNELKKVAETSEQSPQ